jgi:hypothetical protein
MKKIGAAAEQRFIKWCWEKEVETEDKRDQKLGHDFLINKIKGKPAKIRVEIKNYNGSGLIPVEELCEATDGREDVRLGWVWTTDAHYLIYCSAEELIWFAMPDFKKWYEQNCNKYQVRHRENINWKGQRWQNNYRLVPLEDIPTCAKICKL